MAALLSLSKIVAPPPLKQLNTSVQEAHIVEFPDGRDGMKKRKVGSAVEVILKAEGRDRLDPGVTKVIRGTGCHQKDMALNFLASYRVPPFRPLSQGICGLPGLGEGNHSHSHRIS